MKRITMTRSDIGSIIRMVALAPAAISAETMKKRRASSRSANPRKALPRVPATKPACTLLVSRPARAPKMPNSAVSDGTTAVAENHSAIAANSQTASTVRAKVFEAAIPDMGSG